MNLRIENLSLQKHNKCLVRALHLTIKPGEFWGILGPNGCGKTSLLHTLSRLEQAQQGIITLNDIPLNRYQPKVLAQHIGLLLQEYQLIFPQTLHAYCLDARFPHHSHLHAQQHADRQMLHDIFLQLDLLSIQQKYLHTCSGGEKQRAYIASLLMQNPNIYLLDEPTNHLDISYQLKVLSIFRELATKKHAAIVMSLHDLNLAQMFCDYVLLIFPEGQTIAGKTAEIFSASNLSKLYQHPVKKLLDNQQTPHWVAQYAMV